MLSWAILFFIVAVVAGLLGLYAVASAAALAAKVLLIGFVLVAAIGLVQGLRRRADSS